MSTTESQSIYAQFGIQPVVNAMGNVTLLGGSSYLPAVQAALNASNTVFAPMEEVLEKTGAAIAKMLNAESAYVTSGCYAALVLGIASIMTGKEPGRIAQLPDATGMKSEFLLQKATRYRYDRCITAAGGTMIEVGDDDSCTTAQMEAAIGPNTAGILFFAHGAHTPHTLSLSDVVAVAKRHDVAVIVDAAGEVYPLEHMTSLPQSGADLVCFGAKYVGSGHSTGILCGRRELIEAAHLNNFVGYEAYTNRSLGRGYKTDRQEIVATAVALREWLEMDHEERLQGQATRIQTILDGLTDLPYVHARNVWEEETYAWMRLRISLDHALGKSAAGVAAELKAGDPSIWVRVEGDDIVIVPHTLAAGETELVRDRLRAALIQ